MLGTTNASAIVVVGEHALGKLASGELTLGDIALSELALAERSWYTKIWLITLEPSMWEICHQISSL